MKRVLAVVLLTLAAPQSGPLDWRDDFPPQDYQIVHLLEARYRAADAAERRRTAPADVETVRALAAVGNIDDMLRSLRLIVDAHPGRMGAAFEAIRPRIHALRGEDSQNIARREVLRRIIEDGRRKLGELPREEAARAEYGFVQVEDLLWPDGREGSRRLYALSVNYEGTEHALLAEVDLIADGRAYGLEKIAALDAFIADHPGTTAAAKAIYLKGAEYGSVNLVRDGPEAADPARRFEQVQDVVRELESGRYPESRWTQQAAGLIESFSLPDDTRVLPNDLDRIISAVEAQARRRFGAARYRDRGLEHLITSTLPDLYGQRGDRDAQFEHFLSTLERSADAIAAVQLMRNEHYHVSQERETPQAREARAARISAALRAAAAAENVRTQGRILATIAAFEIQAGQCGAALETLREYLDRYPRTSWSWVAWIRTGQCEEVVGNVGSAIAAFRRAADAGEEVPPAQALGHAYAGQLLHATGAMAEARDEFEVALGAWDDAFGGSYSAPASYPFGAERSRVFASTATNVTKDALRDRIAVLTEVLSVPGGAVLEHARARFERDDFDAAESLAARFLTDHPDSPMASEARDMLRIARLQRAVALATGAAAADRVRADEMLDDLTRGPYDFAALLARIARASLRWNAGIDRTAQELQELKAAFSEWQARQVLREPRPGIEEDLAGIREAVFRPQGGGVYADYWAQYPWPDATVPFLIVDPDLRVSLGNGEFETFTIAHRLPDADRILFLNDTQLELLSDLSFALRRGIAQNPDPGVSRAVTLLRHLFPERRGDWTVWNLEAFPVIDAIVFTNADRTTASVEVNIADTWGTVELEKAGGRWIARRVVNFRIS